MHSTEVGSAGGGTPQFLGKLWKLVEDSKYDNLISWGQDGKTFIIRNQLDFAKEVLPLYFKHNNMASFVRQLNMYGFRKIANIEQGGLKCEKDEIEFQHQYFIRGHEFYLPLIKRKIGKTHETAQMNPEAMVKMVEEFSTLKNKQETLDSELTNLKRENEVVWREVAALRQKHSQQQQIINRMIQFLCSMVRTSNRVPTKRKIPLMYTESQIKREKNSFFTVDEKNITEPVSPATGPVIRDVTNSEGLESFSPIDPQLNETMTSSIAAESPKTESEVVADNLNSFTLPTKQTLDPILTEVLNCEPSTSTFNSETSLNLENPNDDSTIAIATKNDVADYLEGIPNDLESMLEFFSNHNYLERLPNANFSFDTSAMPDLYNTDDPFPVGILGDECFEDKNEITGTELVQYTPSLLELSEDGVALPNGVDFSEFDVHVDNILPKLELANAQQDQDLNTPDPLLTSPEFRTTTDKI